MGRNSKSRVQSFTGVRRAKIHWQVKPVGPPRRDRPAPLCPPRAPALQASAPPAPTPTSVSSPETHHITRESAAVQFPELISAAPPGFHPYSVGPSSLHPPDPGADHPRSDQARPAGRPHSREDEQTSSTAHDRQLLQPPPRPALRIDLIVWHVRVCAGVPA